MFEIGAVTKFSNSSRRICSVTKARLSSLGNYVLGFEEWCEGIKYSMRGPNSTWSCPFAIALINYINKTTVDLCRENQYDAFSLQLSWTDRKKGQEEPFPLQWGKDSECSPSGRLRPLSTPKGKHSSLLQAPGGSLKGESSLFWRLREVSSFRSLSYFRWRIDITFF